MPIVDLQVVSAGAIGLPPKEVQAVADALGHVFGAAPGRTWVRASTLPSGAYAENDVRLTEEDLPVFVTILHAHPPVGEALTAEVLAVTVTVAKCLARMEGRVHVQYAPPGAGRIAFGGKLVQ